MCPGLQVVPIYDDRQIQQWPRFLESIRYLLLFLREYMYIRQYTADHAFIFDGVNCKKPSQLGLGFQKIISLQFFIKNQPVSVLLVPELLDTGWLLIKICKLVVF
jgi:hypothetical protein